MRRFVTLLAVVAICLSWFAKASCFNLLDPDTWPFIPIPEVATDPNGGTTYGLLPVFLFHDPKSKRINSILAPDITNNDTLGVGATFRYLAYPSEDTQWYVTGGFQQHITRRIDLMFSTGRTRSKWWSLEARFFWEHDPTSRFFGLGNDSDEDNQTNYTLEQLYFQAWLGLNLSQELQIALIERPRYVRISRGAFDNLPYIGTLFPGIKGLDGGSEWLNEVIVSYDTRDSVDIPSSGGLARAWGAIADRSFGSSISYTRFGGEVRHYFPFWKRFVLAMRAYINMMPAGNEVPFWSLSSLGGEHSTLLTLQETLRGYGTDRFVDNNMIVLNAELRTEVFSLNLFKTRAGIELAPFVDSGRVWHALSDNPFCRFHTAGGMGFRAVIKPFVVGYVDVGYGSEGTAVFSGINYAF